ncbi:MAG TPA: dihydroxyacetone kinase subunit DhaL [Actinocrinis sp.]|jgi:dihydroxyacetone kinase-like protein|uniref:dihydroxyacetone kinase subunit DhaL n=1 Tax=Actinocrinis sp. TaxID=1920516 RepID=UPI002DDD2EA2|nr:dihydroxyacetone kinase subunit DhaL [Actinocrinis sp.]HEV3169051.1 dihydroxyacetone kinase subunit DhaL [Actinocrinis sp.]
MNPPDGPDARFDSVSFDDASSDTASSDTVLFDTAFFRAWITRVADAVEAEREHLTALDSAIGDGDHGANLSRGFAAVMRTFDVSSPRTPATVLVLTGTTLISKVGGASGPLYGTAFRRAGQALNDAPDVDLAGLAGALGAALAAVRKLGAAHDGDKTMVDALAPAVETLDKAVLAGASPRDALTAAAAAAEAGAEATIPMQAHKGRASYLGPRSVGHKDPGAASTALILAALRDTAVAIEGGHSGADAGGDTRSGDGGEHDDGDDTSGDDTGSDSTDHVA